MNAKKCKELRRDARDLAGDKPERRLVYKDETTNTVINDKNSVRGVYRLLKRKFREGVI
jgi:hypothetical protein